MSRREILFHAQCFDGVVSAALAWDWLDASGPVAETVLKPVGYAVQDAWLQTPLLAGTAVVDFLFHPDAAFWADHHATTFRDERMRQWVETAGRSEWIYDATAKSCAGLLFRRLPRRGEHPVAAFEDAVGWADRIDSAEYASAEEAVFPREPAPTIALSFAVREDPSYSIRLATLLKGSGGDLRQVAADEQVRLAIGEALRRVELGVGALRRGVTQSDEDVVTFDVEEGDALIPRYAPYLVNPDARYSAGIVRRPGETKITAMRNPWRDFRGVHLGLLCKRYGGGGHERVGSVLLRNAPASRAGEVLGGILTELRAHS